MKCPKGYPWNTGNVSCEECDSWVISKILPKSDRHPLGFAVQKCKEAEE